jgi:hypothetical protein
MFALLSARLRRWLLIAVAAPMVGRMLENAGQRLETGNGPTRVTRGLRTTGRLLGRRGRLGTRRGRGRGPRSFG